MLYEIIMGMFGTMFNVVKRAITGGEKKKEKPEPEVVVGEICIIIP